MQRKPTEPFLFQSHLIVPIGDHYRIYLLNGKLMRRTAATAEAACQLVQWLVASKASTITLQQIRNRSGVESRPGSC